MKFGNLEMQNLGKHEPRPIHPERLEAMANAEIILEAIKDSKTKEADFIDENIKGFTRVEVENDLKRVELRKEDFEKDYDHLTEDEIKRIKIGEKRGKALETIIVSIAGKRSEHGDARYDWYGKDAYVMETTEFDDICNGVDGVLEFNVGKGESHKIALAIDASMRADLSSIKRKMLRGAKKIADGKMEVKYFKSAVSDYKGKLRSVIPIVLGLEGDKANELIRLFAEVVKLEGKQEKTSEEEQLLTQKICEAQKHPCQVVFLREMKVQLEMYQQIFNREGSFIVHDLKEMLKIVNKLLDDKSDIHLESLEHDGVYEKICEVAEHLPKERDEIFGKKKKP